MTIARPAKGRWHIIDHGVVLCALGKHRDRWRHGELAAAAWDKVTDRCKRCDSRWQDLKRRGKEIKE